MHLGNSILCPYTAIPAFVVSAGVAVCALKGAKHDFKKEDIFKITSSTALIFALQMINFSYPSLNFSAHIVGGALLAMLLGSNIGYLSMCLILLLQALLFNDGGLMALGANAFNMGIIPCFILKPLYDKFDKYKSAFGAFLFSALSVELAALSASLFAYLSGSISSFSAFSSNMLLAHLPICVIEGVFCAVIVKLSEKISQNRLSGAFLAISIILAGFISKYVSTKPDGLEWSLFKLGDGFIAQTQGALYNISQALQLKTSILANLPVIYSGLIGVGLICAVVYTLSHLVEE